MTRRAFAGTQPWRSKPALVVAILTLDKTSGDSTWLCSRHNLSCDAGTSSMQTIPTNVQDPMYSSTACTLGHCICKVATINAGLCLSGHAVLSVQSPPGWLIVLPVSQRSGPPGHAVARPQLCTAEPASHHVRLLAPGPTFAPESRPPRLADASVGTSKLRHPPAGG